LTAGDGKKKEVVYFSVVLEKVCWFSEKCKNIVK